MFCVVYQVYLPVLAPFESRARDDFRKVSLSHGSDLSIEVARALTYSAILTTQSTSRLRKVGWQGQLQKEKAKKGKVSGVVSKA